MQKSFSSFIEHVHLQLNSWSNGAMYHEEMRATTVEGSPLIFKHAQPPRKGAVLILLYEQDAHFLFPLTQRHEYAGVHSGQVSLPGGKSEPHETAIDTALREAEEEIGVDVNSIEVLGTFTELHVLPSNIVVTPVVGFTRTMPKFIAEPKEVKQIITPSVMQLLQPETRQEKIIQTERYTLKAPSFLIENNIVWGATAMMLNEFKNCVRSFFY